MYKFKSFIVVNKINWTILSSNINAINILEQNLDKVDWYELSKNINAIHILEKNLNKIKWNVLSYNINAVPILENNLDYINWTLLSKNTNIFELDYNYLKERTGIYKEELIQKALHPNRLLYWLDNGLSIDDLFI